VSDPEIHTEEATTEVRVPAESLDDLAADLRARVEEARAAYPRHDDTPAVPEVPRDDTEGEVRSVFILALGGQDYTTELEALAAWVDYLLLPVYGREISASRPWCPQWREHPEAVARLHGLWLAWQQLTDIEAGLTGPAVWHRDYLDHVLAQLRDPSGPFAACTTSPSRASHRLLPTPADLDLAA
jgi:hypothetical protein